MNFQELNTLIESLKKNKKANKDLIKFYESKRKAILTEVFNNACDSITHIKQPINKTK